MLTLYDLYTVFKILFNFTPSKGEPQALENLTYKNLKS